MRAKRPTLGGERCDRRRETPAWPEPAGDGLAAVAIPPVCADGPAAAEMRGSAPAMNGSATGPGKTHILTVRGEPDLTTADSLYLRARAAISRCARLLLLDLTAVSFCDARGLSALVRIANDAGAAGCHYGLVAPRPNVARILRITGLDNRLHVFTSIDRACAGRYQEQPAEDPSLEVRDVVLPGSRTRP